MIKEENGVIYFDNGFVIEGKSVKSNTILDGTYYAVYIDSVCEISLPNPKQFEKHNYYLVNKTQEDITIRVIGDGYIGNVGTQTTLQIKSGECYHVKNDLTRWLILAVAETYNSDSLLRIESNSSIIESTWSGVTNYSKTFSVNGALVGKNVSVWFDQIMSNALFQNGNHIISLYGVVSAPNQVTVYARIASYLVVPPNAKWYVSIQ
jgi:hypothetical protein